MRRYLIAKRAVDLVLCLALLPCVLPVVALCALAIKIESRGPVFFGCRRVGFRGRELRMLKFRKMRDGVRRWPARARSVTVEHPRPALGSPGQERLLDRIVVIGCRRLEHVFRADRRHSNIRHLLKRGGDQVKLRKRSGRGRGMRTAVVLGERSRVGNASCGEALVAGVMRASATLQRFIRPARKRRACRIAARDAERRSAVTYSTQ